jgi:Ca2+-binding RTX toxin-like protein
MFTMVRRVSVVGLSTLILVSLASALATANTVPTSTASNTSFAITPNDLKPPECAGISLTAKIASGGNITGTGAAELIVGGPAAQTINGGAGADCILGGAGDDSISGGTGADVCIGGPGTDTFTSCATSYQ